MNKANTAIESIKDFISENEAIAYKARIGDNQKKVRNEFQDISVKAQMIERNIIKANAFLKAAEILKVDRTQEFLRA